MPVEFAVADLPAAAMHADQHRRRIPSLRQIKIAEQPHAVMLGEHDVRFDRDLILFHCRTLDRTLTAMPSVTVYTDTTSPIFP